jgi:hypothetical protein
MGVGELRPQGNRRGMERWLESDELEHWQAQQTRARKLASACRREPRTTTREDMWSCSAQVSSCLREGDKTDSQRRGAPGTQMGLMASSQRRNWSAAQGTSQWCDHG